MTGITSHSGVLSEEPARLFDLSLFFLYLPIFQFKRCEPRPVHPYNKYNFHVHNGKKTSSPLLVKFQNKSFWEKVTFIFFFAK